MDTFGIIFLFILMLTAPCVIALRSSGQMKKGNSAYGEIDEEPDFDLDEPAETLPALTALAAAPNLKVDRPLTLSELALRAESDARIAQELAHEAHYAALAAAAYAARLRADAAIEAAHLAEKAIREMPLSFDAEYFVTQPSALEAKAASRAA